LIFSCDLIYFNFSLIIPVLLFYCLISFLFFSFVDQLLVGCGGYDYDNDVEGKEDLNKVKEILSQHPSLLYERLDKFENTPLIFASLYDSLAFIEFLLSCDGIEVNQQDMVRFSLF
jgi:hypothetical protein